MVIATFRLTPEALDYDAKITINIQCSLIFSNHVPCKCQIVIHLQGLALSPTSRSFDVWKDTSNLPPMYFNIYFFNWTNPEELEIPGKKPHLVQLGPYAFRWATFTQIIGPARSIDEIAASEIKNKTKARPPHTSMILIARLHAQHSWNNIDFHSFTSSKRYEGYRYKFHAKCLAIIKLWRQKY